MWRCSKTTVCSICSSFPPSCAMCIDVRPKSWVCRVLVACCSLAIIPLPPDGYLESYAVDTGTHTLFFDFNLGPSHTVLFLPRTTHFFKKKRRSARLPLLPHRRAHSEDAPRDGAHALPDTVISAQMTEKGWMKRTTEAKGTDCRKRLVHPEREINTLRVSIFQPETHIPFRPAEGAKSGRGGRAG
ncbi:hypothetical protein C8R43DRAFT_189799 [Mycena crocata]|nr:hypothetical protein C8R43DRAFT_189799 [Mycena crocata]